MWWNWRQTGEAWATGGVWIAAQHATFLPRCLDLITAEEVIRRIQLYFDGGAVRFLDERERAACEATISGIVIAN